MQDKEITVSVDENEKNIENEQSNIGDKNIKDTSKLSADKNIESLQAVITEVPLNNNLRESNTHSRSNDKKYTVAYNYRPNARQGHNQQHDSPDFGERNGTRPVFVYDPESRNSFIKLVMTLLLIMLILNALFLAYVRMTPSAMSFFRHSGWVLSIVALIVLMGLNYSIACSPCVRVPPGNFIFLLIAVIALSIITAQITSFYKTEIILYTTVATSAVVFVCFLLAFSSFDFTAWMLYVVVISTAFAVIGLIVFLTMFITGVIMKPVMLIILIVATLIEVVMLTIELQTILGGRTVELSEDDYALGAFMLYTSIISIFLKMVQILGLIEDM